MKALENILKIILLVAAASLFLAGCGTIDVGIESLVTPPVASEIEPGGSTGEVETPQATLDVPSATPTETQEVPTPYVEGWQYWAVGEDTRSGVRFAVPCFWEYEVPVEDTSAMGSFSIRNYPYSFAESFPRGVGVFEAGGIKIDVLYFDYATWGLPEDSTPRELVESMYGQENGESKLVSLEEMVLNTQPALRVTTESNFGIGVMYWFDLSTQYAFALSPVPVEADSSKDVQGILNSISLTSDTDVHVPNYLPSPPPAGVEAPCLSDVAYPTDTGELTSTLDCMTTDTASAQYAACNVQDGLRSGNLSALISWMGDPFVIGYWGSEGSSASPQEVLDELRQSRLPEDTSTLTFTTDRDKFPPLAGMPPENMFGPQVDIAEIVYSEGWGQDGKGAALLYIAQDGSRSYYWYGMVLSFEHFDK